MHDPGRAAGERGPGGSRAHRQARAGGGRAAGVSHARVVDANAHLSPRGWIVESAQPVDSTSALELASVLRLSAEQRSVLEAADRYARAELHPLAARMDAEEWWPEDLFPRLGAAGFLGS